MSSLETGVVDASRCQVAVGQDYHWLVVAVDDDTGYQLAVCQAVAVSFTVQQVFVLETVFSV